MKILFACGGTGGHIFPGVALAEAIQKLAPKAEIIFIGTRRGLEEKILAKTPWKLLTMDIPSFANRPWLGKLGYGFELLAPCWRGMKIMRAEQPDLVIGVGGYVQVPLFLAAALRKIPLLTIEPNSLPGLANRWLKCLVKEVFIAYPDVKKYFGKKAKLLGVPIRERMLRAQSLPQPKRTVLVFGGSLGAKVINELLLAGLPLLREWKDQIHFIHQIGVRADRLAIERQYQQSGFSAEVIPFIEDMGAVYAKADLVIARAGASTVAELLALAKPALLIPYPHAQGNHQEANARYLEQLGGAKCFPEKDLTEDVLAKAIHGLLDAPDQLRKMSQALGKLNRAEAADRIAQECLKYV